MERLAHHKYDISRAKNIWLIPNQENVHSIYQRTSIFLVPSLWAEGFGRGIAEAQLSGIPVLASNRGGMPEALNGGGKLFEMPKESIANYWAPPDPKKVLEWWGSIEELLSNKDTYESFHKQAVISSKKYHPDNTATKVVEFFNKMS